MTRIFRDSLEYKDHIERVKKALRGIGIEGPLYNFKASDLLQKIKIDGFEELMLSTWAMQQYLIAHLKMIRCPYDGGHKVGTLHIAVEKLIPFIVPGNSTVNFITHEAEALEKVSRAAYAWMKNYRMLKGQKNLGPNNAWPEWD